MLVAAWNSQLCICTTFLFVQQNMLPLLCPQDCSRCKQQNLWLMCCKNLSESIVSLVKYFSTPGSKEGDSWWTWRPTCSPSRPVLECTECTTSHVTPTVESGNWKVADEILTYVDINNINIHTYFQDFWAQSYWWVVGKIRYSGGVHLCERKLVNWRI
jgi:hypothetical protein